MIRLQVTNILRLVTCLVFVISIGIVSSPKMARAAGGLNNRFDRISTSAAGATAIHRIGFDITEPAIALGSIEFEFCSNDPLPGTACTAPVGFNALGSTLTQSGNTGFSIDGTSTANRILLTRFPSLPSAVASVYQFANVTNPSNVGSYYVRLSTFSSNDGTGTSVEDGGLVFAITGGVSINTEVPPYLKFCASVVIVGYDCSTATNFSIDMGVLSSVSTSQSSSEMVVATNGEFGYNVTMSGTTMTSGNNTIPGLSSPTASAAGSSQFGVNLRANSNPAVGAEPSGPGTGSITASYAVPNNYKFINGEVLTSSPGSSDNRKYTISYITNISSSQPPGIYATTLTYICLANF
jgi:hypothetical protein